MKSERRAGPTPNGGVESVAYYLDAGGQPAEKADAARVRIVEYDAEGRVVFTTHLEVAGAAVPAGPGEGEDDDEEPGGVSLDGSGREKEAP
jgi:hypothetical protein